MDTFDALADPVRRAILEELQRHPRSAGEIARRFPISRPAVSRHLRILRAAGLVSVTRQGRQQIYRLEPKPLSELDAWLVQFRSTWESRLDALDTEVHRTRRERERRMQSNDQQGPRVDDAGPTRIDSAKEQPA